MSGKQGRKLERKRDGLDSKKDKQTHTKKNNPRLTQTDKNYSTREMLSP